MQNNNGKILKKAILFVSVVVGSFLGIAIIFGMTGLLDKGGAIADIAALLAFILPIVFGVLAVKSKKWNAATDEEDVEPHTTPEKPAQVVAPLREDAVATAPIIVEAEKNFVAPTSVPKESVKTEAKAAKVSSATEPTQQTKIVTYKVTGVAHYTKNIMALAITDEDYDLSKRDLIDEERIEEKIWKYIFPYDTAELVPEPENPYDPNAIKVVVAGQHIGYIKSGSCAHLLKIIKQNAILKIDCKITGGPYKVIHEEEFDDIEDNYTYSMEKDSKDFYVRLSITERR